jgi:chemotaxis protein methyltransferase CheR
MMTDEEYGYLKKKFLRLTNIDLDAYKSQQMRRRLSAYIENSPTRNVAEYCMKLEQSPEMLEKMRNYMAINVSEFFRDLQLFEQLKSIVLPQLLQRSPRLNIWSAGCSHGEEPYTLAMILDQLTPMAPHRILATDIDDEALEQARAGGPYSHEVMRSLPAVLLQKYFTKLPNGNYMVSDDLKRRIIFRKHNLLGDAFENSFDLILCRNVTIYFTEETKNVLFGKFLESLKRGGFLFSGGTEVMLNASSIGFINVKASLYQKPEVADRPGAEPRVLARV